MHTVIFTPEAQDQLLALFQYIAEAASHRIAQDYTTAIIDYCESLKTFPHRGTRRDDIRTGIRITHYKKRTIIAFEVSDEIVAILGIFYGGQDYESVLQSS